MEIGVNIPDKSDVQAILDDVSPERRRQRLRGRKVPFYIWRWHIFFLTAVATGMRSDELRALLWKNVHLDEGVIRVLHGLDADMTLGRPKTDAGYRDMPISPEVVEAFREWEKICPTPTANGLVFPTSKGKPLDHSNMLEEVWHPILERLGMVEKDGSYKYVFHGLRHFYASIMIEAGIQPKRLQKLMGHADFQTTMNIYGHLFPESESETQMIHGAVTAVLVGRQDDKNGQNDDMAEKDGENPRVFETTP